MISRKALSALNLDPGDLESARRAVPHNLSKPQGIDNLRDAAGRESCAVGTKSRETIYGASVRAAAERATVARRDADKLAFQGPAQPSPPIGDALNAGFRYSR